MKAALAIALSFALGGCATRVHYDYFEPAGLDSVIRMPPEAPKNVATLAWNRCEIQVRAEVAKDRIVVTLRAFLPPGTSASFDGDRATLSVGESKEDLRLSWSEWALEDGVGRRYEVPFDAPLKPQSFATSPRRLGHEDMGRYETTIILPERHSSVQDFALDLPSPKGRERLHLSFVRKTADFRYWTQLQ